MESERGKVEMGQEFRERSRWSDEAPFSPFFTNICES